MARRSVLLLTALLAAAGLPGCRGGGTVEPAEVPTGRSMVLVSVDTLRSDRLPAYGYGGVETPAFDALAADGVLFERAYSPVPLTLPAHASLLTGLLPPAHGVRDNAGYRLGEDAGATVAELLAEAGYATGAAVSSFVLRRETGMARGFDLYDDRLEGTERATLSQIQRPGGLTLEPALAWLRERAASGAEEPFFLFFHIYEPHTPYDPPEPFASRYPSAYDGEIAASDRIVGDLVQGLRDLGLYDGATVVLLSDHGEGLGDHGEEEHGVLLYRESLQVPLIVKLPGAAHAGERVEAPVQLTDVTATLLELGGAPVPEEVAGTSLLGFLGAEVPDGADPDGRALYAETFHPRLRFGWSGLTSVVRGRYHYVETEGADRELYDLVADPGEERNLVQEDRRAYAELRDALAGFDTALEAPFQEASGTRRALAALGYLGGGAGTGEGPPVDPKEHLDDLDALRRGVDLLQAGDTGQALPLLRRSAEAIPRSIDAWQFLGLALARTGRPEEALAAYERAFELSNGSPLLAEPMAQVALRLQRWDDAAAFLELALEEEPDRLPLRFARGRALLLAGRPDDALAEAREAVRRAPESPDAQYLLGAVHMGQGRLGEAEASFREALGLAPDHAGALSDLAVLLMGQGRRDEARRVLERLVEVQPENRQARQALERL